MTVYFRHVLLVLYTRTCSEHLGVRDYLAGVYGNVTSYHISCSSHSKFVVLKSEFSSHSGLGT